jgi:serine/threonine-protein kinase RsbW
MKQQRAFANTPSAVARARHFVVRQLADVPGDVVDEVAIMVSELATNCVRHTVTDFTVSVEYSRGEILVEVTDSGGGMPTVRRPESSEPSGRGLRIVQELADSFGVRELSGAPGKTVWFVVALDEESVDPAVRERDRRNDPSGEPSRTKTRGPRRLRVHGSNDLTTSPEARRPARPPAGRRDVRRAARSRPRCALSRTGPPGVRS